MRKICVVTGTRAEFGLMQNLLKKIEIARMFDSEFSSHPFPRSFDGIRALALLRGAAAGFVAAEAFMLLRQRITRESN